MMLSNVPEIAVRQRLNKPDHEGRTDQKGPHRGVYSNGLGGAGKTALLLGLVHGAGGVVTVCEDPCKFVPDCTAECPVGTLPLNNGSVGYLTRLYDISDASTDCDLKGHWDNAEAFIDVLQPEGSYPESWPPCGEPHEDTETALVLYVQLGGEKGAFLASALGCGESDPQERGRDLTVRALCYPDPGMPQHPEETISIILDNARITAEYLKELLIEQKLLPPEARGVNATMRDQLCGGKLCIITTDAELEANGVEKREIFSADGIVSDAGLKEGLLNLQHIQLGVLRAERNAVLEKLDICDIAYGEAVAKIPTNSEVIIDQCSITRGIQVDKVTTEL